MAVDFRPSSDPLPTHMGLFPFNWYPQSLHASSKSGLNKSGCRAIWFGGSEIKSYLNCFLGNQDNRCIEFAVIIDPCPRLRSIDKSITSFPLRSNPRMFRCPAYLPHFAPGHRSSGKSPSSGWPADCVCVHKTVPFAQKYTCRPC